MVNAIDILYNGVWMKWKKWSVTWISVYVCAVCVLRVSECGGYGKG